MLLNPINGLLSFIVSSRKYFIAMMIEVTISKIANKFSEQDFMAENLYLWGYKHDLNLVLVLFRLEAISVNWKKYVATMCQGFTQYWQ